MYRTSSGLSPQALARLSIKQNETADECDMCFQLRSSGVLPARKKRHPVTLKQRR